MHISYAVYAYFNAIRAFSCNSGSYKCVVHINVCMYVFVYVYAHFNAANIGHAVSVFATIHV